jgi:hypothetical protein
MTIFNEDFRVRIPALLHLARPGHADLPRLAAATAGERPAVRGMTLLSFQPTR